MPLNNKEQEELEKWIDIIAEKAHEMGLNPYPTNFEVVPSKIIYELGSYGLPGRFSHWTRGRDYHRQKSSYDHGMSKIYEIVFNTDPTQAFLMEGNSMLSHKFVVAHVMGHSDFFRRNTYFAHTDRRMIERVRLHADRIRSYEDEFGWENVEKFLDTVLSIEHHFDTTSILTKKKTPEQYIEDRKRGNEPSRTDYDDLWNTESKEKAKTPPRKIPEEPERDILLFLANYSRELEDWQRDIIQMVREEGYYFLPQMQTKIINEGHASYVHEKILESLDLTSEEHWEFRRLHSSVLSPGSPTRINPYYLGFQMLKDIERRWDGIVEYDDKPELDWLGREQVRPVGYGKQKLFEVTEQENDVSFLRKYLTESLVKKLDLYVFKREEEPDEDGGHSYTVQNKEWENVRDGIVESMTNFGLPIIQIENADYNRKGELYIRHLFDGKEIHDEETNEVLNNIAKIWGRKVHLHSKYKNGNDKVYESENES